MMMILRRILGDVAGVAWRSAVVLAMVVVMVRAALAHY